MRIVLYLPDLLPRGWSGRLLPTCRPGSCSSRQSPPAAADRCSGRAGSGRSPPGTGTPQWLSSGGASSHLRSSPLSPARTEDAAEQRKKSLFACFFFPLRQLPAELQLSQWAGSGCKPRCEILAAAVNSCIHSKKMKMTESTPAHYLLLNDLR